MPTSECCGSTAQVWKKDLERQNPKAAESLADPAEYPNLFPNLDWALKAEQLQAAMLARDAPPADQYQVRLMLGGAAGSGAMSR